MTERKREEKEKEGKNECEKERLCMCDEMKRKFCVCGSERYCGKLRLFDVT